MTAYGEHYAVYWDVNKNPPPAFQAGDGVPHNEAFYKTFNPLIQRGNNVASLTSCNRNFRAFGNILERG